MKITLRRRARLPVGKGAASAPGGACVSRLGCAPSAGDGHIYKFANLDGTLNFVETGNMDAKMIREILRDIA
jgi:hypothetical protein